ERATSMSAAKFTDPLATARSGAVAATSAALAWMRWTSPPAQCRSIRRFWPSVQPSSRSPWRNAAIRATPSRSSAALVIMTARRADGAPPPPSPRSEAARHSPRAPLVALALGPEDKQKIVAIVEAVVGATRHRAARPGGHRVRFPRPLGRQWEEHPSDLQPIA